MLGQRDLIQALYLVQYFVLLPFPIPVLPGAPRELARRLQSQGRYMRRQF